MVDKLKCPFCGKEIKIAGERTTIMSCFNGECCGSGLYGEEAMWQALIQAKQDLEIARKALESIRDDLFCQRKITARQALEQIEHKE